MTDPARITEDSLTRIEEDETLARSAQERASTPWQATYGRQVETSRDGYLVTPEDEHSYTTDPPDAVALHIARHDPVRVLAECEAKRRIVGLHGGFVPWPTSPRTVCETCAENAEADYDGAPMLAWPCPTLRHLAGIYADHPDYREEWKL